jgi:TPR repeat protein
MQPSPIKVFATSIMKNAMAILALFFCYDCCAQNSSGTNSSSAFGESWASISNRWSVVPIEKATEAAGSNDVSAQYYLASIYYYGIGVTKDFDQSFNWMNKAAAQGMPRAQRRLALMYLNGEGVEANTSEALRYAQMAANENDSYAQNLMGWFYKNGRGVPDDPQEAVKWYQKAAEQGQIDAQISLAYIYASGVYGPTNTFGQGAEAQIKSGGVAPNHGLAEMWMKKGVDLNSAKGQFDFAKLLYSEFDTNGFQEQAKFPEAAEWYKKAAEQNYAPAQYELAEMYNYGKLGDDQRTNCIPWYLKAAAQGNADAQAEIGQLRQLYPNSDLLNTVDPIAALKNAADQGDLSAQFELAKRYHHGDGVAKDPAEAFKWMKMAAGHEISPVTLTIDAHYYLGVMYETGDGTPVDLTNAYRLYQEAAVGGNKPEPFTRVGEMYENGEGVPKDVSLAVENYVQALQFGFFPTSDDSARCTAIAHLLNLYVKGRDLPQSKDELAGLLGELKRTPIIAPKSQWLLGEIYFQGKIVPQDLVEAGAWMMLAANNNFENSKTRLEEIEKSMSSDQKSAEQKRFTELNEKVEQANASYHQMGNYRRENVW